MRLLPGTLSLVLALSACTAPDAPHPRIDLPDSTVVGLAWPADDALVVTLDDGARPTAWRTYRAAVPSGVLTPVPLPDVAECERVEYAWPSRLGDGRVGLARTCSAPRGTRPPSTSALVALDLSTGAVEVLSRLGPDLFPRSASWDPQVRRAIAEQSSDVCASLFWAGPDGPADLPLELGEGDQRWRVDEELRSGDCRGGRADWPAWSPDGSRIAFFSSPSSVGREGQDRLDAPWDLVLLDPDDLSTRTLVEDVERAGATTWSPDGREIAWTSADGTHVVAADGDGEPRRVLEESAGWLAWSPAGDRLAAVVAVPGSSAVDRADEIRLVDVGSSGD